ncbi:MAG: hypothetical protein PUF50_03495 [Erysipelotrichaceae bacterium]|nr:hypothetical protein [Erysipelotrichaceae bacterium]
MFCNEIASENKKMHCCIYVEFTNKGICMNCVLACECHDDMDMLVEHAQDSLKKLLSVFHAKEAKDRNMQR